MPKNDLQATAVMVTGATGGLGQNLARRLARQHAYDTIVLAVRSAERGEILRDNLHSEFPDVTFETAVMNVASLSSVRTAVGRLKRRLDGIVLAAGSTGGSDPAALTPDGINGIFASNIVGHVLLVGLTITSDLLHGTVEYVSSEAAFGVPALRMPAPRIDDGSVDEFTSWIDGSWYAGRKFDSGLAYGQAKLLGALWIGALARLHPELRTIAMSPGNTSGTGILRDLRLPVRVLAPRINALLGRSHSLDTGTDRLAAGLLDPAYGTGRFWASAEGKLTGPAVDQAAAHPMMENQSLQDNASLALHTFLAP
jgi:NAD(P)-dependent dehydrogenase (short-subunit alcohol dehydrogenase family)